MLRSRLSIAAVTVGLTLAAAAPAQAAPPVADLDRDGVFDDLEKRVRSVPGNRDVKVIVTLSADATRRRAGRLEDEVGSLEVSQRFSIIDAVSAVVDADEVRELANAPGVEHVERNARVYGFNETAQRWFGVEEVRLDYPNIDGGDGVAAYSKDTDMVAAVIDSGIEHPDLNPKVIHEEDFVTPADPQLNPHGTGLEPISFGYEWQRCDRSLAACERIANAGDDRYRLRVADVGSRIVARVAASNADGTAQANTSATETVEPARPTALRRPGITGGARDGGVLRATGGSWWGTPELEFGVTWLRCSRRGTNCRAVAFRAAYVPTRGDLGRRLRARVISENEAGRSTSTSAPSAIVRSLPSPRPKPRNKRGLRVRVASEPDGTPRRTEVRAVDL